MKQKAAVKLTAIIALLSILTTTTQGQKATIVEEQVVFKTYPYSDPNPVPIITKNSKIYPYFKFEGYSHLGKEESWKVIRLENDYIIVWVMPEIGGKVWGAIEKSTGKDFIYKNDVVKFRNIAMRGPWTMGGIEFNFGIIGHTPSTASKVDYMLRENEDGSVSCIVGNLDLPSRTQWSVEVRLPADKAYFETNVLWHNPTALNQSYYNWMTGTAVASQDLEFFCPGNMYLEHSGESKPWPVDAQGRKISVYKENNFGPSKSYHVGGTLDNFFGGYYHDSKFGFGHWSLNEEMPGKKIWMWTQSRSGEIWADLASDTHGQHIEFQAGRMFSQHSGNRPNPISQFGFSPYASDRWEEIWFPIKEIGGMTSSSHYGILNITEENNILTIGVNALQNMVDTLYLEVDHTIVKREPLSLKPMEVFTTNIPIKAGSDFEIYVGDKELYYTSMQDSLIIKRPFKTSEEVQLSHRQRLVNEGLDAMNYREYKKAITIFKGLLEKDGSDKEALLALSQLHYGRGEYDKSLHLSSLALMQTTYDGRANYLAGIAYRKKEDFVNAVESLGWAARSIEFRSAAYEQMAEIYIRLTSYDLAVKYAQKSLDFNRYNISALEAQIIATRLMGNETKDLTGELLKIDPLNHLARYEEYLSERTDMKKESFSKHITSEFPEETYLELALFYHALGLNNEAKELLSITPSCVKNSLWLAYLSRNDDADFSMDLLSKSLASSAEFVFPFRLESLEMQAWARSQTSSWKIDYFQAMAYAGVGRNDEALELLISLKEQPDFWVFYQTRAAFLGSTNLKQQKSDLMKAHQLAPDIWRTWDQLIRFYLANNEYAIAADQSGRAYRKFPENFVLGSLHAKALLKAGEYQQCIKILKGIHMLPAEGATAGHRLWQEAHIRLSLELIEKKRYKASVNTLQDALEWPENLGVGKPYDPEQRKEEFLLAYCYDKLGNKSLSNKHLENIIDYTRNTIDRSKPDHYHFIPETIDRMPEYYLGLMALKISGQEDEAEALLLQINNSPQFDSNAKQWINDLYNNMDIDSSTKEAYTANMKLSIQVANIFNE
ncbi:MAG: DUF5107 domain-containing protein [Bacteroidota bacterium]